MQFLINDMSCQHCVDRITTTIRTLDPSASVHCDLSTKLVDVASTIIPSTLINAINDAGYFAQLQNH